MFKFTNNDLSYSYRFIADTPGTHFYHGHLSVGRGDGNVGGFVVIKPNETTPDLNGTRLNIEREYYVLIQVDYYVLLHPTYPNFRTSALYQQTINCQPVY